MRARAVRVLALFAGVTLSGAGCDRIAGTNPANIAMVQRHFDSLAIADSVQLMRGASNDSLEAIREVQRRTDSILALTRPELGAPLGASAAAGMRSQGASAARAGDAGAATTPGTSAAASAAATLDEMSARMAGAAGINAQVTADVQRRMSRAQSIGDSIANAKVEQIVGQNRAAVASDSVRGTIQLTGSTPGTRPVLVSGGANIALTGIGGEGLQNLAGAEVVVRGMRVSPRDIVVSSFSVRVMNGIPVLDGRLSRAGNGWNIELSDRSGSRVLNGIPAALQAAVGARIWIDAANSARPQTYGIIARR